MIWSLLRSSSLQIPPRYAYLLVLDVVRTIERLVSFPKPGRVVPEILDPNIREILLGNCRIVYRLREETVEILTIYHAARLLGPGSLR